MWKTRSSTTKYLDRSLQIKPIFDFPWPQIVLTSPNMIWFYSWMFSIGICPTRKVFLFNWKNFLIQLQIWHNMEPMVQIRSTLWLKSKSSSLMQPNEVQSTHLGAESFSEVAFEFSCPYNLTMIFPPLKSILRFSWHVINSRIVRIFAH